MTETPAAPRRSRVVWILAAVLALVIVFVVAFFLLQRGLTVDPVPSPTSTEVSTPSPSPSGNANATPTPTATESVPPGPDPRAANFVDAMTSGNTAALEGELANPIFVAQAATGCCGDVDPVTAINLLDYVNPGSGATWNFAIDEATLADYRSGEYAEYFPPQALVGQSSDGFLVSFIPAEPGGLIETLLIALVIVL